MMIKKIQSGVTLLEVLITLIILAIGLLGLAAMQLHGSQTNHSAYLRSQASFLAYDMYDRMRANRALALDESSYATNLSDPAPTISTNCVTSDCSAEEMAVFDLNQWKTAIEELLPAGESEIVFSSVGGTSSMVTINIVWEDSRMSEKIENFTFQAEL